MKRKKKAIVGEQSMLEESKCCTFCNLDVNDELLYGEIKSTHKVNAHFFCLLFSSGLNQRGKDHQGIYGFLLNDIEKELNRGKRLACSYCKKLGATIGCGKGNCAKKFHLPCGRQNGSLHQFFGCYESFCSQHKPKQDKIKINKEDICVICHEYLLSFSPNAVLNSTCCINSKYHFNCLQNYAIHAGDIHFRCPKCQNVDKFKKEMLTYGVYIPDQDASWEREENAFQELLVRHDVCDCSKCLCPNGRNYQDERQWLLVLCICCGSQGCHAACGKIPVRKPSWVCKDCYSIVCKTKSFKTPKKAYTRSNSSIQASFPTSTSLATLSRVAKIKPCVVVLDKLHDGITGTSTDQDSYEMYIQDLNADIDKASDLEAEDVDIITIDSDVEIEEETAPLTRRRTDRIVNMNDNEVVVIDFLENRASLSVATSNDKGTDSISESSNILFDTDDESFENLEYIKAIKSMIDTVLLIDDVDIEDLLSDKQTLELNHPAPNSTIVSIEEDSNEILLEKINVRAENRKKRKYRRVPKLQNEENAKPKSVERAKRKISSKNGNYNDGNSESSLSKVLKTMVNQNDERSANICNNDADSCTKVSNRKARRGKPANKRFIRTKKISKAVKLVNRSEIHRKTLHINQLRSKNSSFTRYSMTKEESRTISNFVEGKVSEIIDICNQSLMNSSLDNKEEAHASGSKLTGTQDKDDGLTEPSESKSKNKPKNSNNSLRKREKKGKKKNKCNTIILENENRFSKMNKICKDCSVCDNLKSHFHTMKMGEY